MIKAVIFDFGGVLAKPSWTTATLVDIIKKDLGEQKNFLTEDFEKTLEEIMAKKMQIATYSMKEIPFEFVIKESLERYGVNVDTKMLEKIVWDISNADLHRVLPETELVLKTLKKEGYKVGVASNTSLYIPRRILERKGLAKYIDAIVLSREVGYRKPHPKIYEEILNKLNVKASESIFVGDVLEIDIYGAKSVGMIGILISEKEPVYDELNIDLSKLNIKKEIKPDFIIDSIIEIPKILKQLN
ncbi:MAG: HAD family hydrolase [Candidatus Njordarchaeum guaymaensis]